MKNNHTWVICAYGESEFLEACILSLRAQTIRSKIICYSSTPLDSIRQLCQAYEIPFYTKEGGGIGTDWNNALSFVDSQYATIAHQDDYYEPTYLEAVLQKIEQFKDVLIAYTDYFEEKNGVKILALGICLIGIWFILRLWIKPLHELQETILAIGSGNAHLRAVEKGSPELIDLAKQFNTMLNQIDKLMMAVKEEEQNVRKYELQALSSQINPHFLYNTLDTIVWMAEFNDSKRVVEVTKSLAKYFRLALNQGHEQISLKDEIDHVRQYLFIQKQRYGEKLQYEIEELSAYDNYQIPKLILQPLVENAIYHGIKEMNRQGMIRVTVYENSHQLILSIYDNGRGFIDHDTADTLLMHLGGVGLKNVNQRLQLQFGKSYHMEIKSEEHTYTEIRLYFPKANKTN